LPLTFSLDYKESSLGQIAGRFFNVNFLLERKWDFGKGCYRWGKIQNSNKGESPIVDLAIIYGLVTTVKDL
jgi:hypothetical protein